MFIFPCPLSAKATRIECLQSSALENGKIRTIHRVINPLFIALPVVLPDQNILEIFAHSESPFLRRRPLSLLCRFLLFGLSNSGNIEKEEDSKEIENDIS